MDIKRALSDPTRVLEALGIEVVAWRELLQLQDDRQAARSLRMFARHVNLNGPTIIGDPCWVWTGATDKDGYAKFGNKRGSCRAARLVLLATSDVTVDNACHYCDNPPCVRPSHLWPGTTADNNADCVAKGRATGGAIEPARGRRHGRYTKPERTCRGERHPSAKLTPAKVIAIRAEYATGSVGARALAAKYGVARNAIRMIVSGRSWGHV